jgi:hypothetical protein
MLIIRSSFFLTGSDHHLSCSIHNEPLRPVHFHAIQYKNKRQTCKQNRALEITQVNFNYNNTFQIYDEGLQIKKKTQLPST